MAGIEGTGEHTFDKKSLYHAKEWCEETMKLMGDNNDLSFGPTKAQLEDRMKILKRLISDLETNSKKSKYEPNTGIK